MLEKFKKALEAIEALEKAKWELEAFVRGEDADFYPPDGIELSYDDDCSGEGPIRTEREVREVKALLNALLDYEWLDLAVGAQLRWVSGKRLCVSLTESGRESFFVPINDLIDDFIGSESEELAGEELRDCPDELKDMTCREVLAKQVAGFLREVAERIDPNK